MAAKKPAKKAVAKAPAKKAAVAKKTPTVKKASGGRTDADGYSGMGETRTSTTQRAKKRGVEINRAGWNPAPLDRTMFREGVEQRQVHSKYGKPTGTTKVYLDRAEKNPSLTSKNLDKKGNWKGKKIPYSTETPVVSSRGNKFIISTYGSNTWATAVPADRKKKKKK